MGIIELEDFKRLEAKLDLCLFGLGLISQFLGMDRRLQEHGPSKHLVDAWLRSIKQPSGLYDATGFGGNGNE